MCTLVLMMELYMWQGSTVALIQEDMHGFVGLLFIKSNPYVPDSFLNPNCRNQYPSTVMYYGGSCKTSLGPLFQNWRKQPSFTIHLLSWLYNIVSYRLLHYSRVLYMPHRTLSEFEIWQIFSLYNNSFSEDFHCYDSSPPWGTCCFVIWLKFLDLHAHFRMLC